MKISNFRDLKTTEKGTMIAAVDVKSLLPFRKTKKRLVALEKSRNYWVFLHNGQYTPDLQVERLHVAYELLQEYAKEILKNEKPL